jgi:hypothetical protein
VFLLASKSEYTNAGTSKSLVTITNIISNVRNRRIRPKQVGILMEFFYLFKYFSLMFVISIWYKAMEQDVKIYFGSKLRTPYDLSPISFPP